MQVVN